MASDRPARSAGNKGRLSRPCRQSPQDGGTAREADRARRGCGFDRPRQGTRGPRSWRHHAGGNRNVDSCGHRAGAADRAAQQGRRLACDETRLGGSDGNLPVHSPCHTASAWPYCAARMTDIVPPWGSPNAAARHAEGSSLAAVASRRSRCVIALFEMAIGGLAHPDIFGRRRWPHTHQWRMN